MPNMQPLIISVCKLCLQAKELRDSHIIPQWAHAPLKDDEGQMIVYSSASNTADPRQTDIKMKMLCSDCEAIMKFYDDKGKEYHVQILNGAPTTPQTAKEASLFALSVVWRTCAAGIIQIDELTNGWRQHFLLKNAEAVAQGMTIKIVINPNATSMLTRPMLMKTNSIQFVIPQIKFEVFFDGQNPAKIEWYSTTDPALGIRFKEEPKTSERAQKRINRTASKKLKKKR